MTTKEETVIQTESESIIIQNLEINDQNVVDYISERDDDSPEDGIRLALRVGVSTLRLSDTTEEMEYVRHEFDKITQEFQNEIDELRDELEDWFDDEDGDLIELIENTFEKDEEVIDDDTVVVDTHEGQIVFTNEDDCGYCGDDVVGVVVWDTEYFTLCESVCERHKDSVLEKNSRAEFRSLEQ